MFQGPLYPNLSQKVQKEVSQMSNRNLPLDAIRWFKCKLKPPKKYQIHPPLFDLYTTTFDKSWCEI